MLGARKYDYVCDQNQPSYDLNFSGGVIKANQVEFVANGKDIEFVEKDNNRHGYANYILGCDFDGLHDLAGTLTPLYDIRYNNNIPGFYPNLQNPWAGAANPFGRGAVGILANQIKILNISGNSFDDIQRCMRLFDTRNSISNSTFNNTKVGIEIRNFVSGVNNSHLIVNCDFDNLDPLGVPNRGDAIYIEGGILEKIDHCVIGLNSTQNDITVGIETRNSANYNIVDNDFWNVSGGLLLQGTVLGSSFIGNEDDLVGNRFTDCRFGIFSNADNTTVDVDCNDFRPVLAPNPF